MKFLCDGMLGKLCKLMRLCGFDTEYSNEGLKVLVQAKREDRIILTKNTRLKDRAGVFFLTGDDPVVQLRTVLGQYKMNQDIWFFSRCLVCNDQLLHMSKERVKGKVPYYTYRNFNEFAECPKCQRIYWKGSHYENMQKKISGMLKKCKNLET